MQAVTKCEAKKKKKSACSLLNEHKALSCKREEMEKKTNEYNYTGTIQEVQQILVKRNQSKCL